jgi:hypothetical protein
VLGRRGARQREAAVVHSWEVIVVDDGSPVPITPARTDDIVLVRQPNTGPGGARNVGSSLARGSLVAYLDSDDRMRPGKLEKQVALHARRPELVLSATDFVHFDASGVREVEGWQKRRAQRTEEITFDQLFAENCIACSSTMMPRAALAKTPGMSIHRRLGEDYGLWLRLARLGPIGYLDEPLLERRLHPGSLMHEQMRAGTIEAREREVYEEFLIEFPELRASPAVRSALARVDHQHGWAHLQRQEWDEARRLILQSLRADPMRPKVWIDLARSLLHVGPRRAHEFER